MSKMIEDYFALSPHDRRSWIEESKSSSLFSVGSSIPEILQRATNPEIKEGFDGAVLLLSELSERAIINFCDGLYKAWFDGQLQIKDQETNLEILISAIACSSKVNLSQKLKILDKFLLLSASSRIVKTSIIDVFIILEEELGNQETQKYLSPFLTDSDEYVRECAGEALYDLENYDKIVEKSMIEIVQGASGEILKNPIDYPTAKKIWIEAWLSVPKPAAPKDILPIAINILKTRLSGK